MEDYFFDYDQVCSHIDNSKFAPLVRALWKLEQNHTSRLGILASLGNLLVRPEQGLRKGFDLVVYTTILKMGDKFNDKIYTAIIKEYKGCEAVGLKNLVNCKEKECNWIYKLSEPLFNAYLNLYGPMFIEYEKSLNEGRPYENVSDVIVGAYRSDDFLNAVKKIADTSEPVIETIIYELMQKKKTLRIGLLGLRVIYSIAIEEIRKIPKKIITISREEAIEWYE